MKISLKLVDGSEVVIFEFSYDKEPRQFRKGISTFLTSQSFHNGPGSQVHSRDP